MKLHIITAAIFIIQKHVVIIWMITGRQGATHKLSKGVSMVEIGGFHQLQLMGMATKNVFNFVLMNKVNQDD